MELKIKLEECKVKVKVKRVRFLRNHLKAKLVIIDNNIL